MKQPWVQFHEVFSLQELTDIVNSVWAYGLHVIKIEFHQSEFFQSWLVFYGNRLAYDALHGPGFETHKLKGLKPKKK